MKESKYICFLIILSICVACSQSSYMAEEGSRIPLGAEVLPYENIPGLTRITVKEEGKIIGEGDFMNGVEHGAWTDYTSDGMVMKITNYYMGVQQGSTFSFKNNEIVLKANYSAGELDGDYRKYDRRKVIEEKFYKSGSLQGLVKKYYKSGVLMEEANYVDGKLEGIAKWYNQEGELSIAYEYANGELVDKNPNVQ